jgi:hypothetical protein
LGDYVYKENGIMSEGCSNVLSRRVRVDSIKSVETYGENKFVSKDGTKYEYVSSAVTYVIMRRLGTEEEVVFWKDTESRGTRGGYLINMLTTVPFDDYCDDIAVCRIDGEYYCKECFENTFRGKVRSLMETAEVEETIPEKNLSTV